MVSKEELRKKVELPALEEIVEINRRLGLKVPDTGKIEFLISKIRAMRLGKNMKKNLAKIAANLWYYIIVDHPFVDGNKRTASEVMLFFLENNSAKLRMPPNGIIYISLKIANGDITLKQLEKEIYGKLEVEE